MGPVRGLKKRKKTEKKHDENGSASASASGSPEKEGHIDWWNEFSKRINGTLFFFFYHLIVSLCLASSMFALPFMYDIAFTDEYWYNGYVGVHRLFFYFIFFI